MDRCCSSVEMEIGRQALRLVRLARLDMGRSMLGHQLHSPPRVPRSGWSLKSGSLEMAALASTPLLSLMVARNLRRIEWSSGPWQSGGSFQYASRNFGGGLPGRMNARAAMVADVGVVSTSDPSAEEAGIRKKAVADAAAKSGGGGKAYDAGQIQVLKGLEPVRKRPGMYIGSTGVKGLHHLVWEVVDNAIDEVQAGFATSVDVELLADGSVSITDNGRGIPTDIHPATGKSALETVLTVLHAGGKFGGDSTGYRVSGGLHGVGISVVNALSERLEVTVWRDGQAYTQAFERGSPVTALETHQLPTNGAPRSGTRILFKPDPKVFKESASFDFDTICTRLRELAFLNSQVTIHARHFARGPAGEPRQEVFHYAGGLREYVEWVNRDKDGLHDAIAFTTDKDGTTVDVALQWCADAYSDTILGYANSIRTSDGGTHLEGMKQAITRTLNALARKSGKLKEKDANLNGEHVREGLTCVVSVKVADPEFEGQTKTRLGNPEVRKTVDAAVSDAVAEYLEFHPDTLDTILNKAIQAFKAAEAAKKARELVRRKNVLTRSTLPGKLADCSSSDPALSEIFIVEGDSAGGSAKQGRDRMFQAVLPLRGKILNVERKDDASIYKNQEIQNMILALGLGIKGEEFDLAALRYQRIIILTDADVDGAHIRTLLLTFLFRYQRALFENGHVFVGVPPLYKVERGKAVKYCYTENELQRYLARTGLAGPQVNIQRFKGLGEMMPQQLWDTTLDPLKRMLKKLTVDEAAEANSMFSLLMGDKVGPRKELIQRLGPQMKLEMLDV